MFLREYNIRKEKKSHSNQIKVGQSKPTEGKERSKRNRKQIGIENHLHTQESHRNTKSEIRIYMQKICWVKKIEIENIKNKIKTKKCPDTMA